VVDLVPNFLKRFGTSFTNFAKWSCILCVSGCGLQSAVSDIYQTKIGPVSSSDDLDKAALTVAQAIKTEQEASGPASESYITAVDQAIIIARKRFVLSVNQRSPFGDMRALYPLAELRRALEASRANFGENSDKYRKILNHFAFELVSVDLWRDAEPLLRDLLALNEKQLGDRDPRLLPVLWRLAKVLEREQQERAAIAAGSRWRIIKDGQEECRDSEPLLRRALSLPGINSTEMLIETAQAASYLAWCTGSRDEALRLRTYAVTLFDRVAPGTSEERDELLALCIRQEVNQRNDEAIATARKLVELDEKAEGRVDPRSRLADLHLLSDVLLRVNQVDEAEAIINDAATLSRRYIAAGNAPLVGIEADLGRIALRKGRYAEARDHYRNDIAAVAQLSGLPRYRDDIMYLLRLRTQLGYALLANRETKAAIAELEQAIREGAGEPSQIAFAEVGLGWAALVDSRITDAIEWLTRADQVFKFIELVFFEGKADATSALAIAEHLKGNYDGAIVHGRAAAATYRKEFLTFEKENLDPDFNSRSRTFLMLADDLYRVGATHPGDRQRFFEESFAVAQEAAITAASSAIAAMASRFAPRPGPLGDLIRDEQDTSQRLKDVQGSLGAILAVLPERRDHRKETELRESLNQETMHLGELRNRLSLEFPAFSELADPRPISEREVQDLLGPNEALIAIQPFKRLTNFDLQINAPRTLVWVVRRNAATEYSSDLGESELANAVRELRSGIDLSNAESDSLPAFDTAVAYKLYKGLFGPAEHMLEGTEHLIVVAHGALTGIPPGILVTALSGSTNHAKYRDVAWLSEKYAISVLPAVSSLAALRRHRDWNPGLRPFLGFGDPALSGPENEARSGHFPVLLARGVSADDVRKLPRLPETAQELLYVGTALGATSRDLFLGERMTRADLLSAPLAESRILYFATHGLVSGDIPGLTEAALVLTPSANDDGLLKTSDVAQLNLNASWVVLSACNTASGNTPGAEALSGLAKAFFYAGAKNLLVSHWPVETGSTVELMESIFSANYGVERHRAAAIQRAMAHVRTDVNALTSRRSPGNGSQRLSQLLYA
jgi:CHAT domain-containing protein